MIKERAGRNARTMTTKPRQDKPMKRFIENVDVEKLEAFLGNEEKYRTLVAALHDPAYAQCGFAWIARKCGVTLAELQAIYTDGMRQIGMLRMSTALPEVMGDVVEDARSKKVVCPRCDGFKVGPVKGGGERECPVCAGTGEVTQIGDKHARDLVFETMKLTGQGGPLVAIQQNFGQSGLDDRMEHMLRVTQTLTLGAKSAGEPE